MNYKSFNLGDWIGHISGVIEDETTLDGNEMRDLVEFLTTLKQEPCEDAISRRDMALNIVSFYNKATGKKKTLDFLCKCVEGLPSVQPKTGWIPVSERLPEKNGQYLVTTASVCGALITIRSYAKKFSRIDPYDFRSAKGGGWYDYDSEVGHWRDTDVKAWMELPEPFDGNTK